MGTDEHRGVVGLSKMLNFLSFVLPPTVQHLTKVFLCFTLEVLEVSQGLLVAGWLLCSNPPF